MFVPVGGGGLVAGVGAYLKNCPHIKIIAVETYDFLRCIQSLKAKLLI